MNPTECYECARQMSPTEPYWSVNLHNEMYEDGVIHVISAIAIAVFCEACASKRDLDNILIPLKHGANGSQ